MAVWDKRESETTKAYEAFLAYRDLGPQRSLQKAADIYYGKPSANKRYVEIWSSKHDWVDRVNAYDDYQRAEYEREVAKQFEEDRRKAREKRQRTIQALHQVLNNVMSAQHDALDPSTLNQLSNAAKTIMEQSRAEFNDLPTQRNQTDITSGGEPLRSLTAADLSDDDLAAVIASGEGD